MIRISRIAVLVATVALAAAACGSPAATGTPAAPTLAPASHAAPSAASSTAAAIAPSTAPTTAATVAPTEGATSAPTPVASVAVVAAIPPELLLFAGKLVICSDMPYPPQEYFDANGNPIGSDIEIGQAIAARLGLQAQIVNSYFDSIIPALTGGKCDAIISAMNINADRLTQLDMIPYFQAGQAFLVQKGNPSNIQTTTDLCGKIVAVETATTMLDYLSGTSAFKGAGLPKICSDAGLPAVTAKPFGKDPDALAALQSGTADAYFSDLPVVIGYAAAQPDAFEVAPVPQIDPALEGIGVAKPADPSQAHSPIYDAVKTALLATMSDGSYQAILAKYAVDSGAVTPDDVNAPQTAPSAAPS